MNLKPIIQSMLPKGLEAKPSDSDADFYYITLPGQEIPCTGFYAGGLSNLPAAQITEILERKVKPCVETMQKHLGVV